MSVIRARLVAAAQSGRLEKEFTEMIDDIERLLRSGECDVYMHELKCESDGHALVARLKTEDIAASVVGGCVKVELAPFFEPEKSQPTEATRIHLDLTSRELTPDAIEKIRRWTAHLLPSVVGDAIEFSLPGVFDGKTYIFHFLGNSFGLVCKTKEAVVLIPALQQAGFVDASVSGCYLTILSVPTSIPKH